MVFPCGACWYHLYNSIASRDDVHRRERASDVTRLLCAIQDHRTRRRSPGNATSLTATQVCMSLNARTFELVLLHTPTSLIRHQLAIERFRMEANTTSALLALPVELVMRIIDSLDKEHLLMVRLVCNSFDTIKFDRFAEEYFAHVYCWIAASKSYERLRIIMAKSSRLRDRIGQVTFTANILEDQSVNAVNVVCKQAQTELQARKGTTQAIYGSEPRTLENTDLIQRTLLDIQSLRQDVLVDLDLTGMVQLVPDRFDDSYGAILSAMAATHIQARELTTFGGAFAYLVLNPNYD